MKAVNFFLFYIEDNRKLGLTPLACSYYILIVTVNISNITGQKGSDR